MLTPILIRIESIHKVGVSYLSGFSPEEVSFVSENVVSENLTTCDLLLYIFLAG